MKKIKIEDLRVGMVIEKMGRSWLEHPFLTGKKKITSEKQILLLKQSGIVDVYIDTDMGLDVEISAEPVAAEPPSVEPLPADPAPPAPVPFAEEIRVARVVQREAQTVVQGVMQDVRMGRNIESGKVGRVVNNMIDSIFRNQDALVSLTRLKGYDGYTFVHSINVCVLCLTLGRHMNFSREDLHVLGIGALLHDTGKMRVPSSILNKAGKLTEEEFAEIKRHPLYSAEVLDKAGGIPEDAKRVALQHHERYGGGGYPYGLKGEEIARFSRIAAIMDVYDAITSDRCYQRGIPPHEGIRKIYEWGRRDFQISFVERFVQCLGIYPIGTLVQLDTEEIGVVSSINREKLLRPQVLLLFRDPGRRYPDPVPADLMERAADPQRYKRTIVKPLDPRDWSIKVDQYLPQTGEMAAFR